MIAFAASLLAPWLFCTAALASGVVIVSTMRRYAPGARMLRAQLRNCPDTLTVTWKIVERVHLPALGSLRKRPVRRMPVRLEWPGLASSGFGDLAA
ncbi:hypothetical protein [Novosphingobium gossypii]|uniref:hypothetical protein n=1 Tax=Novosphingobium gossypii TaxID=1604774 RepID=UPI003D1B3FE7